MKKLSVAIIMTLPFSSVAYAQEASNFDGAKIGAVVGYDNVSLKSGFDSGSKGGFLYGLTAGFDRDLRGIILGVEAEIAASTTKETASDVAATGDYFKLSAGREIAVGVRAGIVATQELMIYAKGGYTNARAKLAASYHGATAFRESDTLDGYRIGGGAEYAINAKFARVEYRYSDYSHYKYQGFNTGLKAGRHQVAVTSGFRF